MRVCMGEKMDLFKKNKEEPKRKYVVGDKSEAVADEPKEEENVVTVDEPKEEPEAVADEPKQEENVVQQKSITVTQEVYDEIVRLKLKNECETFSEAIDGLICLLREQKEKSNNYHKWIEQCFIESQRIVKEIGTDSEKARFIIFKDMIERYKDDF